MNDLLFKSSKGYSIIYFNALYLLILYLVFIYKDGKGYLTIAFFIYELFNISFKGLIRDIILDNSELVYNKDY